MAEAAEEEEAEEAEEAEVVEVATEMLTSPETIEPSTRREREDMMDLILLTEENSISNQELATREEITDERPDTRRETRLTLPRRSSTLMPTPPPTLLRVMLRSSIPTSLLLLRRSTILPMERLRKSSSPRDSLPRKLELLRRSRPLKRSRRSKEERSTPFPLRPTTLSSQTLMFTLLDNHPTSLPSTLEHRKRKSMFLSHLPIPEVEEEEEAEEAEEEEAPEVAEEEEVAEEVPPPPTSLERPESSRPPLSTRTTSPLSDNKAKKNSLASQ